MHEVTVTRDVDIPAEDAWAILDDFGGVYRYHPLVERSPIINEVESGLGAQRMCHFHDGNVITEEITGYEAGSGYRVEIVDPGNFPLHEAVATLGVEPLSADRSRVSFRMAFKPRFGPIGWLMAKTVMVGQFRKILGRVLEGLEAHARTGEVIGPKARRAAA